MIAMLRFKHIGSFDKTEKFFTNARKRDYTRILERYGREGVAALASATPIDTGLTANSWNYKIKFNKNSVTLYWTNSNVVDGVPIAILLQYGHGTRNGGYVQGRDYINPATRPIFDRLATEVWQEVTKA